VPAAPRPRRKRGSLTRELILDSAEELAQEGFDSLSMRSVAARLKAAPMALYNHFADKEELVDALLDRVLSRFEPPPPTGDWIEDLKAFARAHRKVLTDHAWAVSPLFDHPTPGMSAVVVGEHALAVIRRGEVSNDEAVAIFSGIIALNYGWSSFTAARRLNPAAGEQVAAAMARLPQEAFPNTAAVAAEMVGYGSDEHYESVLDGLVASRARPAAPRAGGGRP
jgi:AcrR family transcriptional regulator